MGASGRWIKALVGFTKSDKSRSSKKDENVSTSKEDYYKSFFLFVLIMPMLVHFCVCLTDEGEGCYQE
jgi:hypothetical protein